MYRARRLAAVLAAVLAAAVLVGACGGGGNGVARLDANTILNRAVNAAKNAKTTHVKGRLTQQGQSFTIDMRLADRGATGTVTVQGKTIDLLRIGQNVYLKADREFYTNASPAAKKLLANKWLEVRTGGSGSGQLATFTKPDQFFTKILESNNTITKGKRTTVRGIPAIELVNSGARGALLVALEGQPYPLQIRSGRGSASQGALNFLDYNQPITLKTPPPDQVVSRSQLRSRTGG